MEYNCGHESEVIIADNNPLSISAYLEWEEGDKEKCFSCWCK